MKIAFVVISFPTISETFILNQITGLIDLGHEVDIFALWDPKEKVVHDDIDKYQLRQRTSYLFISKNRKKRILQFLMMCLRWGWRHPICISKCLNFKRYGRSDAISHCLKLDLFLSKQYDVIHCHYGNLATEIVFLKDIFPAIKFFVSFHGFDFYSKDFQAAGFYTALFSKVDGVIEGGEYYRKMLLNLGCPEYKLIHHPNGVDMSRFVRTVKRSFLNEIVITTIARLEEEKNIPFALNLIHALRREFKFRYYLIGDGSLKSKIIDKIKELEIESVIHLMGDLPQCEVVKVLNETDIFLLTSHRETFGLVLVEAQAMEIPVVAANVGGCSGALQDERTGFLFEPENLDDCYRKISTLLKQTELRWKMGQEGRRFVCERFDITRLSQRLEEIYLKK